MNSLRTLSQETLFGIIPNELFQSIENYISSHITVHFHTNPSELISLVTECEKSHIKSGVLHHRLCDHCKVRRSFAKLDDSVFCQRCLETHGIIYACSLWGTWSRKPRIFSDKECQKMDENGFRKRGNGEGWYPIVMTSSERECRLCYPNYYFADSVHPNCAMCNSKKDLTKVFHWYVGGMWNPAINKSIEGSRIVIRYICSECIKFADDLAFGKEITYIPENNSEEFVSCLVDKKGGYIYL